MTAKTATLRQFRKPKEGDTSAARIHQSGRLAREAGIKRADCPLAKGSPARRWWLQGWNERDKELI